MLGSQSALCCMIAAATQAIAPVPAPPPPAPQPTPSVPSADLPAPPAGFVRIPADTNVDFEIVDALSSKTSKIDDMFAIRLLDPVTVDGAVLLPAGTMGQGQVVHSAKARALGKAGELILTARYLSCGDTHLALRGFHLSLSGKNKSSQITAAVAVGGMIAAPLMFVSGGESIIPAGTRATARLKMPVDVRVQSDAGCTALPVAPPGLVAVVPVKTATQP
jgi:hypothetical protein